MPYQGTGATGYQGSGVLGYEEEKGSGCWAAAVHHGARVLVYQVVEVQSVGVI